MNERERRAAEEQHIAIRLERLGLHAAARARRDFIEAYRGIQAVLRAPLPPEEKE